MIYENIPTEAELKKYGKKQISELCAGLRENIIDSVSRNGGHLASNLGAVELTVALHRAFDFPDDKLIFDVGHQSYAHKMLSGRAQGFEKLRRSGGISGFQQREESEYDFFGGGHSGTSVSAALGFAEAEKMSGGKRFAVAVVGDGSFTNGMIYEAINNASKNDLRLIIVINDNAMSISENVGGMSRYFNRLRTSVSYFRLKRKVKSGLSKLFLIGKPLTAISKAFKNFIKRLVYRENIFEYLGIDYMGPVDGHDVTKLEAIFREAKLLEKTVIVHVCTQKGKGYGLAENEPSLYHSVGIFDKDIGIVINNNKKTFSDCFGEAITSEAKVNGDIAVITAAMCEGTGLDTFRKEFPERFFDTGISEEHSVTFAAGLAAAGKRPVFAVYSSFLQRGFDQIIHDVCMQKLGVLFAIDRSGFVPGDGRTHQGIFDASFLLSVPEMTVYTPETYSDLEEAVSAGLESGKPCAVRYPKGREAVYDRSAFTDLGDFRTAEKGNGKKVTVVTYGRIAGNVFLASEILKDCYSVRIVVLKKIKPLDVRRLYGYMKDSGYVLFVEEQIKTGGVSEHIIAECVSNGLVLQKTDIIASDGFPPHATLDELYDEYGMTPEKIAKKIKNNA